MKKSQSSAPSEEALLLVYWCKTMKCSSSVVTLYVINLLCLVKYATSIMCYDCNSAYDPRCGEEFDPFSLGVVNCSLRDPLDHLPDAEPTLCRAIKMNIYGKTRVVRQCGYLADENATKPCRRQTSTGDVFVTYCSCDTDLCNSATNHLGTSALITFLALLLCRF